MRRAAFIATMSALALLLGELDANADPEPELEREQKTTPAAPSTAESSGTTSGSSGSSDSADVRASSDVAAYADSDHVYVVSPTIAGTVASPTGGWNLGARYLVDVVSAASVDIVSTASRHWSEIRHVGSVDGGYKPGEWGFSAAANISSEPDYLSLSASGAVTKEVFDKNVTLLLGYNHGHDVAGRTGTPFSLFSRKLDINGVKGGATFLIDRSTIVSVVGDVIFESGDSSKPYRYIPMFAPGTSVPRGASVDLVTQLRLSARVLEQLPLSRDRFAASARMAHRFRASTLRLDERAYLDTWGLKATTTDIRFIFDLGERFEIGPHARFHAQTAVDFWQRAYTVRPGFDFPALRTGDRELGPLISVTGGGSIRAFLGKSEDPRTRTLGLDFGLTSTQYLDDLYINTRLAGLGVLSFEATF